MAENAQESEGIMINDHITDGRMNIILIKVHISVSLSITVSYFHERLVKLLFALSFIYLFTYFLIFIYLFTN